MKFKDLELDQALLKAIADQGYDQPSPIQEKAIPVVLQGQDIMAAAQTGTGKTAGFTLPVLHRLIRSKTTSVKGNQARVLVLTPTRELAAQVANSVEIYSKYLQIKSAVVFGGVGINPQMKKLRGGVDVLIATPGRLLDLHEKNAVQFDKLEVLVLDEADRMLDMGFIHDIRRIVKKLPKKRQTLLFSATFSNEIRELAKTFLYKPEEVSVSPANSTVDAVNQLIIPVEKADKTALLAHLIKENDWFQVLVFSRTKHGANRLVRQLENRGIESAAIHGNKSQGARTRALADFKSSKLRVLVATDIAARGIDINQLPQVVNFDLPQVAEDYVHRIGRTGRAGASGEAVSLVGHDEFKQLRDIESLIRKVIPREEISGFEPKNQLPASTTDFKKIKTPKPKKKVSSNEQDGNRSGRRNKAGLSKRNNKASKGSASRSNSKGRAKDGNAAKQNVGKKKDSNSSNAQINRSASGTASGSKKPRPNRSRNRKDSRSSGAIG